MRGSRIDEILYTPGWVKAWTCSDSAPFIFPPQRFSFCFELVTFFSGTNGL
jgi:hypothetical protein